MPKPNIQGAEGQHCWVRVKQLDTPTAIVVLRLTTVGAEDGERRLIKKEVLTNAGEWLVIPEGATYRDHAILDVVVVEQPYPAPSHP